MTVMELCAVAAVAADTAEQVLGSPRLDAAVDGNQI